MLRIGTLLITILIIISCKSNKNDSVSTKSQGTDLNITFLDAAIAGTKITVDKSDGFFGYITKADMSIQMKQKDMPVSGGESKALYQEMLRSEMESFSAEDKTFMTEVMQSAKDALDKVNPALYPQHIDLIKTKTNHYGPDVYYTRDDAIILPANIFDDKAVNAQMPVMLHEIFHILSRYDVTFRERMYALIGFFPYEEQLVLPKRIADYLLTNPDGVTRKYAIHLKNSAGEMQKALPLILSRKERYDESMPSFFSYLNFDLYPLIPVAANQVTLGINQSGESALSLEHNSNFFQQIKDNTQYIIHPDEIMADNFMMAVIAEKNGDFSGFSAEGEQLLRDVLKILREYHQ